jgi:pyridoxamine 5'-phosphate oxidase
MEEKQFDINTLIEANRSNMNEKVLSEDSVDQDPFRQFENWMKDALEKDTMYANAMTLSTVDEKGMPDSRTMLLRNISYGGFTFFTNYKSAKGCQIKHNSKACILFFWKELERQVRIQGDIRFLPPGESDLYFSSRPFDSQVGAWVSQQSEVISGRESLDRAFTNELKKYLGKKVPRPEYWGGYVLLPSAFEFWQGRTGRLHDRIKYTWTQGANNWKMVRLMP